MVGGSGVTTAQGRSVCVSPRPQKHSYISQDNTAPYVWVQCQQTGHSRMEQDDECIGQGAWLFCCWWCHFLTDFGLASLPSIVSTRDGVSSLHPPGRSALHLISHLPPSGLPCSFVPIRGLSALLVCATVVLWPGHRSLARPLAAASRLHVRPRLANSDAAVRF
jgi:hypothetical protein